MYSVKGVKENMKKSKLSIGLVTSFIASMALSACGAKVTKDKDNIVTFKGYSDEELAIRIDDIYDDYMKSSTGIAKYYDQVMEVLIRHAFEKNKTGDSSKYLGGIKKNYNQILNEAKESVKTAKKTAKENADTNGTDYKTEWQSVLSEKGVKDEEELLQYYIYQLEKEGIEDWYYDQHENELRKEYIGVNADGSKVASKVSSRFPYHVRHILIKVEDGANNYVRGTISADQAKLISSTVELLAEGVMTFGEVAQKKSEDTSADTFGDVGVMTNTISSGKLEMVNEFQLGVYAYDAIKKNYTKTGAAEVNKGLGLEGTEVKGGDASKTVQKYFGDATTGRGIVEIPYSVFKELGLVAELENNYDTGLQVEDGKAAIYPRNLLWNRYLNNHSIFVITNGARETNADITGTARDTYDVTEPSVASNKYLTSDTIVSQGKTTNIAYDSLKGFSAGVTGFNGTGEKVLCASETKDGVTTVDPNKVIIGVRSQFGIHLMIVEKSAYDYDATVGLEQYYTTDVATVDNKDVKTYINFIDYSNQKSKYSERAETLKSKIKGFDSTYDYRLYEELKDGEGVNKENEKTKAVFDLIDEYIKVQRNKNKDEQDEGLSEVWQTYIELLKTQDYYRGVNGASNMDRILPEGCKIAFTENTLTEAQKEEFEEGGRCYVK